MIYPEESPFKPPPRSFTEMDRDEIVRQTLTEVETRLSSINVNHTYAQAFKLVSKVLRAMKP